MACGSTFATEVQYDKSVAEAAAKQAAEKIGAIRPSIDYDKEPSITETKPEVEKKVLEEETSEIESQRITELNADDVQAGDKTNNEQTAIDYRPTGSIKAQTPEYKTTVVWEKFDADGNLINKL